ncbi:magnesium transporter CorA family protein [Sinorhizobium sp. BG8]|uniref:magnesium transporter CorA family protein n=1 Tax=Sinorhizobium sp. BG8 TaxID=2613773 RepID=UPI00193DAFE9|nr:magnesium transporter CorA family protein [Sinorhizobium sp. BG8]QRM54496.1 magnesium transporter CorA family protein [Sinorhizobium sp. BG8]
MITVFRSNGEARTLSLPSVEEAPPSLDGAVWIDLLSPTREEEDFVERLLSIDVPTREDLKDIEPSSRLFTENGAVYMTASLVWKADSELPELTDVAFILVGDHLVTIRYAEPKSFGLFKAAMHRIPGGCVSGPVMITRLLETIVDRTAEILERSATEGDALSRQVFGDKQQVTRRPQRYLEDRLMAVAGHQRLVALTQNSLMTLLRLVGYLRTVPALQQDKESRELCRSVSRDLQSLSEHASFIGGNTTFLLDASLGLINLEQNAIIKIFSIASVVLLPPTLIASIYGMNFDHMPELHSTYAYPVSLVAMVVSAVIPFFFFRWKGWL